MEYVPRVWEKTRISSCTWAEVSKLVEQIEWVAAGGAG